MPPGLVTTAAAFVRELTSYRPRMMAVVFVLMLMRSLSEGVTFMLLVPLLSLAGAVSPIPAGGAMPQGLARLQLSWLGAPSVELILVLFLGVILLRAMLGYVTTVVSTRFQNSFVEHVRGRMYRALSRASWLHLAGTRQGQDMHSLTGLAESVASLTFYTLSIAAASLTIVTGLAVAFALSAGLTLAVLAVSVLLAVPMMFYQRQAYQRGNAAMLAMATLHGVLIARLNGLKLAKAFAIERELEKDFAASSADYERAQLKVRENTARASLLQEAGAAVLLSVLVYAGIRQLHLSSLELILLIMLFARLTPLANGLLGQLRSLVGLLPAYRALQEREAAARAAEEPLPVVLKPIALRESLALDRVSFAYADDPGGPVLDDISISVAARSAIGLMGLSGAGKSTLADILAGLTPPSSGRVLVDGVPLDADSRAHWRASVAYVPQDAPLFHDTLRENLRIAARAATDEEIWASLEVVHAASMVARLPGGLDTMAGERGVRFSGGERQRIRLASALLRRPQLLILDESTSALNPADESRIVEALQRLRGEMTIILIAHRASSIGWTDRLLIVKDGRIAADGPPAEILGRSRGVAKEVLGDGGNY